MNDVGAISIAQTAQQFKGLLLMLILHFCGVCANEFAPTTYIIKQRL